MFDWVSLLLRAGYYYGFAIGARNFEIDLRTGRLFTTTRCTLYAFTCNVIILILTGLKLIGRINFPVSFGGTHQLYVCAASSLTILRISAGLINLHNQWRYQSQQMLLVKNLLCLCLASPQLIWMSRWRILLMFCIGIVSDLFQVAFTLRSIHYVDTNICLGMILHFWMSAIFNLFMVQHYLVMLCIRGQYNLLNAELKQVIQESKYLSYNPSRKGAFMTRCCTLADQLDDIAKLQDHLQSIVGQLDGIFGVQGLVVFSGYYVSAVVTNYTTYHFFKENLKNLGLSLEDLILSFAWCFFFYLGGILNLFMAINIQNSHKEMICLLEDRTSFAPGLDVRLEQSYESLQLQLIRNPLNIDIFKLFPISPQSMWATLGSVLLHSISLIQYDIETFNK